VSGVRFQERKTRRGRASVPAGNKSSSTSDIGRHGGRPYSDGKDEQRNEQRTKTVERFFRLGATTDTLYETAPARNSEQIERRTSNVQLPTSNIEGASLCLFKNKRAADSCSESQVSKNKFARMAQALAPRVARYFFKLGSIPYSMLDVQCSMFDVH